MPVQPTAVFFEMLLEVLRPRLEGVEADGALHEFHFERGTATVVVEPRTGGVAVTWRAAGHLDETDPAAGLALANVRTSHSAAKAARQVSQLLWGICADDV